MFGSYSLFWILFFFFQMLLCLFGVFSQLVFMKTTVWDKKITFQCRVYLFFLSIGYQMILVPFMVSTLTCLLTVGSMFEVKECEQARMIPLAFHRFGEFTIVVFHLLINLDRLAVAFRPEKARGRAANVYFHVSYFASMVLSALYVYLFTDKGVSKTIGIVLIVFFTVLNLLIEIKLFHYTDFVYKNTIGLVPLERRFDLSSSVTMIRCFLPASICGIFLKLSLYIFYIVVVALKKPSDHPPLFFVLNLIWNLDCTLFPWFFILFHPSKKEKFKRVLRIGSMPVAQNQKRSQTQQEHFDQFREVWKFRS